MEKGNEEGLIVEIELNLPDGSQELRINKRIQDCFELRASSFRLK